MVDRLFRPTAREPRSVRSPGTGGGEGGRGKSVSIWLENGNRCRGKRRASRCVAIALINSTARRTDRHRRIRLRKSYRIRIICTAMGLPVIARPVPLLFSYSPLLRELLLLPLPLLPDTSRSSLEILILVASRKRNDLLVAVWREWERGGKEGCRRRRLKFPRGGKEESLIEDAGRNACFPAMCLVLDTHLHIAPRRSTTLPLKKRTLHVFFRGTGSRFRSARKGGYR